MNWKIIENWNWIEKNWMSFDHIFYLCLQFSLVVFFFKRPIMFCCNIHCFIVSILNVQCYTMFYNERKWEKIVRSLWKLSFYFHSSNRIFSTCFKSFQKIQCSFTYFMEYLNSKWDHSKLSQCYSLKDILLISLIHL